MSMPTNKEINVPYKTNTVEKYPYIVYAEIENKLKFLEGSIDELESSLPSTAFTDTNTVKKYIDDSVTNVDTELAQRAICFETVADMAAATDLAAGMICHTNGFHTSGDGGAAFYEIKSSGTANAMDIIACQNSLLAHLVIENNTIYPEQIGAISSGVIDIAAFTHLFDLANVIKLNADYEIAFIANSTVANPTRIKIENKTGITVDGCSHTITMSGLTKTYLESINDTSSSGRDIFSFLAFHGCKNITVKDINFIGTNAVGATNKFRYQSPRSICIAFKACENCIANNINGSNILGNVVNATTDDNLTDGCKQIRIVNSTAYNCYENGFNIMGKSTDCIIDNCISNECGGGFEAYGQTSIIQNCTAKKCFASGILISGGAKAFNNVIDGSTGDADGNGCGIQITGVSGDISTGCEAIGNVVTNCNGYGFYVYPYCSNTVIKNNRFVSNGKTETYKIEAYMNGVSANKNDKTIIDSNYFEITEDSHYITNIGYATNFVISNNVFINRAASPAANTISIASTSSDYRIIGNYATKQFNKGTSTNYVIANNVIKNTAPALVTDIT